MIGCKGWSMRVMNATNMIEDHGREESGLQRLGCEGIVCNQHVARAQSFYIMLQSLDKGLIATVTYEIKSNP